MATLREKIRSLVHGLDPLLKEREVTDALVHYSNGELGGKLERITGHGSTKPNESRYPDQPEKNRRVELSLVLDMSKEDLARYK